MGAQALTLNMSNGPTHAADYAPLIVTYRNGAPVRLRDIAHVIDSVEDDKVAAWFNGARTISLNIFREPGVNTVTVSANAQTARNCHIREGEGGVLMNADTQQPFGYKDACIELNPHVGGNPATAEEARKAVSDFVQALFKLG